MMTINGPSPIGPSINVQSVRVAQPAPAAQQASPVRPTEVQAPDGVDPQLWQLLTPDEQTFFAHQSLLGPLTYGPVDDVGPADAPRGQRIDVRA